MHKFPHFLMAFSLFATLCACKETGSNKQPVSWVKFENNKSGQRDVYLKFGTEWRLINNVNEIVMLNQIRALALAESPRYQLLQPGTLIPKIICAGGQLNWVPDRKNLDCTIIGRDLTRYKVEQYRYDLNGEVISQYQADVTYTNQELMASPVFYGAELQRYFLLRQMIPGSVDLQKCTFIRVSPDGLLTQISSGGPVNSSQCTDTAFWTSKLGLPVITAASSDVF